MASLEAAIARIHSRTGSIAGVGVLVHGRKVITCAHLLGVPERMDSARSEPAVTLDFPLVMPGHTLRARISTLRPDLDVAGLVLEDDPPSSAEPIGLIEVEELWGHRFRAFGFPDGMDEGVWATGVIQGRQASGWLQIEDRNNTGYFVCRGFSGSPVWDEALQGVVGIIVASALPATMRTGFIIPSEQLIEAWPEVRHALGSAYELGLRKVYLSAPSSLAEYRRALDKALRRKGYGISVPELSGVTRGRAAEASLASMASCDVFVAVLPRSPETGLSGQERRLIEDEYSLAREFGLERLIYVVDEGRAGRSGSEIESARANALGPVWSEIVSSAVPFANANADTLALEVMRQLTLLAQVRLDFQIRSLRAKVVDQGIAQRVLRRGQRIGTLLPIDMAHRFKDRLGALTLLAKHLADSSVRLISVLGRSGIGKTALVSRILGDLEKGDLTGQGRSLEAQVEGILYLTSRSTGLGLDRIYADLGRLVSHPSSTDLSDRWAARDVPLEEKIDYLLGKLQTGIYVIVLDNLEDYLNADGSLMQEGLRLFVEKCLTRQSGVRLLVTSTRELLIEPGVLHAVRKVDLRDGLAEEDAVALLRDLDPQGNLGLREAADDELRRAARLTRGIPRALEVVAGILARDSTASLSGLLGDGQLLGEQIMEGWITKGYRHLGEDERRVMEALSVLDKPTGMVGIAFVLHPWFPGIDVRASLRRLAKGYFVYVDRGTSEYSLHPLDRDFAYGQIAATDASEYTQENLELRAADYCAMIRKPRVNWMSIDDLTPQLDEFTHLVRARSFGGACALLHEIDFDFLLQWGHYSLLIEMRERLVGEAMAKNLEADNLGSLGRVYYTRGDVGKAVALYQKALVISRQIEDRELEGLWLDNLGIAHYTLGRMDQAVGFYVEALGMARAMRDRRHEGAVLGHIALARRFGGYVEDAERLYREALDIARELGDRRYEGINLGSVGTVYLELGKIEKARRLYAEALAIAREVGDRRREEVWLGHLGIVQVKLKRPDRAIGYLDQAISLSNEIGDLRHRVNWLSSLGDAYALRGQGEQSADRYKEALRIARNIGYRPGEAVQLHALAKTCLGSKRFGKAAQYCGEILAMEETRVGYKASLVLGIVRLIERDQRARATFVDAVRRCKELIDRSAGVFEPHYKLAASLVGVAACDPLWGAPADRAELAAPAIAEYRKAVGICSVAGVIEDALFDFEMIRAGGVEGIEQLIELLRHESAVRAPGLVED
jgi:tetratricopeptide (TPR) repeat protein